jgi:hypothetical protein
VAARVGVRRLARSLASSGYIFFTSSGGRPCSRGERRPELIQVPMGTCFRHVEGEPQHP